MVNYVYVKDNILYRLNYTNEKYPDIYKVSGNYEGEKVIRIHNERILKNKNEIDLRYNLDNVSKEWIKLF